MKNLVSILVLVFAITFTTQAQKKRGHRKADLTTEQHTELAVKRMTLALDLSDKQQKQIKPLIMAKMADRKAAMEKRKAARKDKKRPSSDEMFAMKNKQLDQEILMKSKMKNILNKSQFEKFEKMQKGKKMKAMKKMKMKKNGKKMKKGKKQKKGKDNKDNQFWLISFIEKPGFLIEIGFCLFSDFRQNQNDLLLYQIKVITCETK